ncbi:50S ribosomal protein L23 [Patescibacteria group bacterium]|nr:MAG: 50S ribosomal protein L23 [Patescibacteria group bacterium]
MGLLGNWFKKKKKQQLEQVTEKKADEKKAEPAKAAQPKSAPVVLSGQGGKNVSAKSYQIILHPLVSEKSAVHESQNKYSFVVAGWAGKDEITKAIQELYDVSPLKVRTANIMGRTVRFGRRAGRRSDYKKAVVALPPGETLTLHKGV